jgi:hypothetical protein
VLIIAIDACFRLKRRLVSSEAKDPGLGTGLAYFLENLKYRSYLLTKTDQKEVCQNKYHYCFAISDIFCRCLPAAGYPHWITPTQSSHVATGLLVQEWGCAPAMSSYRGTAQVIFKKVKGKIYLLALIMQLR